MIDSGLAFLAWLGAALIVLSDGRRGLAAGLGVLALGLALLAIGDGQALGGVAVGAGGAIAAFQRWRIGSPRWGIMPAGSTPRLVLCVASGLLALWIAASITTGAGPQLRFAVLVVIGMLGVRVLDTRDGYVVTTAVAGLALAVAGAGGLAGASPGQLPYLAAALAAVAAMFIPRSEPHGA